METQLSLFEKTPDPKPEKLRTRYYKDLNINEKINVKFNSQLPRAVLLQGRKGFDNVSPITRRDYPDYIKEDLFRFHMIYNHGGIRGKKKYEERLALKSKIAMEKYIYK